MSRSHPSSLAAADVDADALSAAVTDPETKQEVLDPVDGPAEWIDLVTEISRGYMRGEDDDFQLLGPQHEEWLDRFAAGQSFGLLAHRFSIKTLTTLSWVAGKLQYEPGTTVLWLTNTRTQATDKAHHEFNKLVRRNPWLTELQEDKRTVDNASKKLFENGSTLAGGWLFGGLEGARADIIIFDDLIKEKGDGDTRDIWEWITGAALPMGKDDSQEIFIGTRKRRGDIYEYIAQKTGYPVIEYPLVRDIWKRNEDAAAGRLADRELYSEINSPLPAEDGTIEVLWPAARGEQFIAEKRSKVGRQMFERAYCLVVGNREGLVYPWFNREDYVVPGHPDTYDQTIYGVDWGFSNPAGVVALQLRGIADGEPDWHVAADHKERRMSNEQIAERIKDMQADHSAGPIYCDAAEPGSIEDLKREGLDARKGDKDVTEGIKEVNDLQDRLTVHESCQDFITEINIYEYKDDREEPVEENDHLMDAFRYAVFTYDTRRQTTSSTWYDPV